MCMVFKPPKFLLQRQRKKIKLCFPYSTRWHAEGLLGRKVIQRPSDLSPFHEICELKKKSNNHKTSFSLMLNKKQASNLVLLSK